VLQVLPLSFTLTVAGALTRVALAGEAGTPFSFPVRGGLCPDIRLNHGSAMT
jgi:hypothetical protein